MNQENNNENSKIDIKDETTEKQVSENYLKNPSPMPASNTSVRDNSLEKQASLVTTTKPTMKASSEPSVIETIDVSKETSEKKLNTEPSNSSMQIDDNELKKAFIGNNYDKITTQKFNFSAAILGGAYMFYRKMLIYGFISMLVYAAVNRLIFVIFNFAWATLTGGAEDIVMFNFILAVIEFLVYFLIYGFFTNKIYLFFVEKNIAKIKAQNINKDYKYIKEECNSVGGENFLYFVLSFFVIVFIYGSYQFF